VDIQEEAVDYIRNRSNELGVENVIPVQGTEQSPNLPEGEVDLVIMVDVYHELAYPQEMLSAIYKSLKPDGKIVLLEYKGEDPSIAIKPLHKMTEKQTKKELKANGFDLVENGKFLPIQHYLIFEKTNSN
jgi:ubiquinone/menaquinone biosynthesis C-methylase UbiE